MVRSALLELDFKTDNIFVGKHPSIIRLSPNVTKNVYNWVVSLVLRYFLDLSPAYDLSTKN